MATFYNQAILSYNNSVTNSNIVTGELLEVLTAAKTAVQGSYRVGDDVTYVISIVNSGAIAYAWYVWVKGYKGETVVKWIN